MAIARSSQQVVSTAKGTVRDWKDRAAGMDRCWTRSLAVSSLITGAILLARGKRKSGLVAAAAGAAIAALDDPKEVAALWNSIPGHIESGKRLITRLERFVEDMSAQGERLRGFLEKAADRKI